MRLWTYNFILSILIEDWIVSIIIIKFEELSTKSSYFVWIIIPTSSCSSTFIIMCTCFTNLFEGCTFSFRTILMNRTVWCSSAWSIMTYRFASGIEAFLCCIKASFSKIKIITWILSIEFFWINIFVLGLTNSRIPIIDITEFKSIALIWENNIKF